MKHKFIFFLSFTIIAIIISICVCFDKSIESFSNETKLDNLKTFINNLEKEGSKFKLAGENIHLNNEKTSGYPVLDVSKTNNNVNNKLDILLSFINALGTSGRNLSETCN